MARTPAQQARYEEARRRRMAGETLKEIGDALGLTREGVRLMTRDVPFTGWRLAPELVEELRRRVAAGESAAAVARDMGINPNRARRWATGIERVPRFTVEQRHEIIRRYIYGESINRLATDYRQEPTTLRGLLEREGVRIRSRVEQGAYISEEARSKRLLPEQRAEARARVAAGERAYQIATELGASVAGVRKLARAGGAPGQAGGDVER